MPNHFLTFDIPYSQLKAVEDKLNERKYFKSAGVVHVGFPSEGFYEINSHQKPDQKAGISLVREEDFLWTIKIHMRSEDSESELRALLSHYS